MFLLCFFFRVRLLFVIFLRKKSEMRTEKKLTEIMTAISSYFIRSDIR